MKNLEIIYDETSRLISKARDQDEDISHFSVTGWQHYMDFMGFEAGKIKAFQSDGSVRNLEMQVFSKKAFNKNQLFEIGYADMYYGGAYIAYPFLPDKVMDILNVYLYYFSSPTYFERKYPAPTISDQRALIPHLKTFPRDYYVPLWKIARSPYSTDLAFTAYLCHLLFYGIDALSEIHVASFPLEYWQGAADATAKYEFATRHKVTCAREIYDLAFSEKYRALPPEEKVRKHIEISMTAAEFSDYLLKKCGIVTAASLERSSFDFFKEHDKYIAGR